MKRENDKSGVGTALFNWFPGHMARALREIKQRLQFVDVVIEIRDARVPVVSGNPELAKSIGQKNHVIVLNKVNLADPLVVEEWQRWFEKSGKTFLFVDCFDKVALKKILTLSRNLSESTRLKSDPSSNPQREKLKVMIVGLPNTGKSTIINQLANKQVAKVADKPGLTTIQSWIKIENDVEMLDTPGVMPPMIENKLHALWLSAIHAIPDDIADEEDTALFLINHMIEHKSPMFMEKYKLETLDLSLDQILQKIATLRGAIKQKGLPDLPRVHKLVISDFREGQFGRASFGKAPKI
jgi:ribosome biogenesis GTPase A